MSMEAGMVGSVGKKKKEEQTIPGLPARLQKEGEG